MKSEFSNLLGHTSKSQIGNCMPQLMFVLLFALSNKPNPNQINVNNVKPGVVNGTGVQAQNTGAGRACESCYSK